MPPRTLPSPRSWGAARYSGTEKIGVFNTAFLGDAVLTLPLLTALRAAYPQAELTFVVRGGLGPLFAGHPAIQRIVELNKRGGQRSIRAAYDFGKALSRQGYGIWLSAHRSLRSALISWASSVPVRVGYDSPAYNRWAYTHTVPRGFREEHEIERLLRLLRPLGVTPRSNWPEYVPPLLAREKAENYWRANIRGPVLGIHPGSAWETKRWPAASFAEVAALALKAGAQVMLFAGPGEEETARKVREAIPAPLRSGLLDVSGALDLPTLAAYLGKLSCYLTNDSGPMHLAWAQRTPVVALFGPTTEELGFFPRGETSTVLQAELACRPCGLHGGRSCPEGHHHCMTMLSPERAFTASAPYLGQEKEQETGAKQGVGSGA